MLTKLIIQILTNAVAIYIATKVVNGFTLAEDSFKVLLTAGFIFGLINFFIKPVLKLISIPLILQERYDFDNHDEQLGSSCNNLTGEDQYSECIPCSDRHIYHEINLSQKRPSTKIDFSFYYRSVKKNDLIPSIINNNIIDNTDIRQLAYQPTITVLRI